MSLLISRMGELFGVVSYRSRPEYRALVMCGRLFDISISDWWKERKRWDTKHMVTFCAGWTKRRGYFGC